MYNYIIVGGGSAGCVLANRLSVNPDCQVLLLEAGPPDRSIFIHWPGAYFRLFNDNYTWGYHAAPAANRHRLEMPFAQARVLGGGSSINGMVFTRGNPKDFDDWAENYGCKGWSYESVLPYFRRSESNQRIFDKFHGNDGNVSVSDLVNPLPISMAFVEAAEQAGIAVNTDFNGATQAGSGMYQVTQRNAKRCSAAVAYLDPIKSRPNLTIKTDCLCTHLQMDGNKVTGVSYLENNRQCLATCIDEVVVTAGAIGSPALLLRSGIGPAADLEKLSITVNQDLAGVGANLQDHIDVYSMYKLKGPYSYDGHKKLHKQLFAALRYMITRTGPVTSNLAESGAFWYTSPAAARPDLQFHFLPGAGIEAGVPPVPGGYGCTINSCYLRPRSLGSVTLQSSDASTPPKINPGYWTQEADMQCSLRGLELTREIAAQPALQQFIDYEHMPGPDCQSHDALTAYAARYGKTDYHPVGTCSMGSGVHAVVDPLCKVYGMQNLRIADSSIMPCLISSNTNATTVMIAEKASDHILQLSQPIDV